MTRSDPNRLPLDISDPRAFTEPWQAQAFAMVVRLHELGVFDWNAWAASLSRHLGQPDRAVDASDYYECWVRALEDILEERSLAGESEIGALQSAWQRAAEATPHGSPVLLRNDPMRTNP